MPPQGQQAHVAHGSSKASSGCSILASSEAAEEKQPTDYANEAALTEIPSPASCDTATPRSSPAVPARTLNPRGLTWPLITISLIIY